MNIMGKVTDKQLLEDIERVVNKHDHAYYVESDMTRRLEENGLTSTGIVSINDLKEILDKKDTIFKVKK